MVIDDLDVVCVSVRPAEANAPLVVDADAVLAPAVALQHFQPVSRRDEQVLKGPGLAEVEQLAPRRPLDRPEASDQMVVEQRLGLGGPEGLDHPERVLRRT